MTDRRQVLRAIALGAVGLALPAACGLPTGGGPIVDGPGPAAGPDTGDTNAQAPVPGDATEPESLVRMFLGAVAGKLDTETDLDKAGERARAFLTANAKTSWQPGSQITVVRVVGNLSQRPGDDGVTLVDAVLEPVGILQTNGAVGVIAGATVPPRVTVRFTVIPNDGESASGNWIIDQIETVSDGPQLAGMLLDSDGLDGRWYVPQLIYFWSTDRGREGLVPDLRYVPVVGRLSNETQRTEIVDWVLAGPSDLLAGAVVDNLYAGINLIGPNLVAPDNNGLLINLSAPPPQGVSLDQVMAQLRWSLRGLYEGRVRLQVASQNQSVDNSDSYLLANLADRAYRRGDETAYCVAGGVVRAVENPDQLPAPLTNLDRDNRNVRFAALSRDLSYAALVKTDKRLYIGGVRGQGAQPEFAAVDLAGNSWTRPVFLPANTPVVLVAVDGSLYQVELGGKKTVIGIDHKVTAFAVAPDGHRIALIGDGQAWVGALRVDGNGISVGSLRAVYSGLSELTGIAWTRLDRVLIAGRGQANYQLSETTIDGAIAEVWSAPSPYEITSVVALPHLPSRSTAAGPAMVQTVNSAYLASPEQFEPIKFTFPGGQPAPSASADGGKNNIGVPSNPFFID